MKGYQTLAVVIKCKEIVSERGKKLPPESEWEINIFTFEL